MSNVELKLQPEKYQDVTDNNAGDKIQKTLHKIISSSNISTPNMAPHIAQYNPLLKYKTTKYGVNYCD